MPPTSDEFVYDAFISYRHREPDQSWVRNTLLPALEAAGLTICIDVRDFRLGGVLLKEMERAVIQSRYTLAVLSEAYLQSSFTEIENLMAQHLGLENKQRRLIALMREACDPSLLQQMRLWLDMTDDSQFETNLARLIAQLKLPPDESA